MTEADENLYADLARAVSARIPAVLEEVGRLLDDVQPDYAQFLREAHDEVLAAAPAFVMRLIDEARGDDLADVDGGIEQSLFEEVGRAHRRDGREVTGLFAAYQVGALALWRVVSEVAVELGVPAAVCAGMAGVVFGAINRLSAYSLRGFEEEQADGRTVQNRLREELTWLLLAERWDGQAVSRAAHAAQWSVPRRAAVVLADPDNDVARDVMGRLPEGTLHAVRSGERVAIVPDPDGPWQRNRITAVLRGADTVVSLAVPIERLATARGLCLRARRIGRSCGISDDPLFVADHLDAILVHQDDELLAALRSRCLSPLEGLSSPARERMSSTLLAWLRQMGDRKAVAAELHVHPQTVSYRIARLRELFGPALDEADVRVNLLLALAWGPGAPEDGDASAAGAPAGAADRPDRAMSSGRT